MITYTVTLKNNKRPATKTVTVDAETALEAKSKAKADNPAYTEVLACTIVRANYSAFSVLSQKSADSLWHYGGRRLFPSPLPIRTDICYTLSHETLCLSHTLGGCGYYHPSHVRLFWNRLIFRLPLILSEPPQKNLNFFAIPPLQAEW